MLLDAIRHHVSVVGALGVSCLLAVGCAGGTEESLGTEDLGSTHESFEEFEARIPWEETLGAYLFEGDIPIYSRGELRELYEAQQHGALVVNQSSGVDTKWSDTQKRNLTYCVSTAFGANYVAVVAAMKAAADAWAFSAQVNFIHASNQDSACNSSNTQVVFDVQPVSGTSYAGTSFFPNWPRSQRILRIDYYNATHSPPLTLTGVLRHELGHVLGFNHEHIRVSGSACADGTYWRSLTPYDAASVMHYRQCPNSSWNLGDYVLTAKDRDGAMRLYGSAMCSRVACANTSGTGVYRGYFCPSHNFITTASISCQAAYDNCVLNANYNPSNNVYCTWQGREIYRREVTSGACSALSSSTCNDPCAATVGTGTYKGYVCESNHNFILTQSISCKEARDNCVLNANSNPGRSFYCKWNDIPIYRREVSAGVCNSIAE